MMVYHKISPDMKQRALQLIDKGWEMQDVADILSVASKSIRQWANNYDTHGRVDSPSVL
jgi:transposase-like protein